ncbi:MAG: hypothetical protein EA392_07680 [Cryomorphaceae bacterium]|nr:MAG: hypothetical protein EA392_07680 [Cryomorphaceae bacterium]
MFITAGYTRDFWALNVNYILYFQQSGQETWEGHSFFDFMLQWPVQHVYYTKYIITLVFTLVNFVLSAAFVWVLFQNKLLLKLMVAMYALISLVALVFFAGGWMLDSAETGYSYARLLMGFLQSPVPAAVLSLSYPLYRKSQESVIR